MSTANSPRFLVNPATEPVAVRIEGRVFFQICSCLKEFLGKAVESGKRNFAIDFAECSGVDSTFLGILARTVLDLRRLDPPGTIVMRGLNERNRELLANLGVDRFIVFDDGPLTDTAPAPAIEQALDVVVEKDQVAAARLVLEAHESLIELNPENREKFQDLLTILTQQVKED